MCVSVCLCVCEEEREREGKTKIEREGKSVWREVECLEGISKLLFQGMMRCNVGWLGEKI